MRLGRSILSYRILFSYLSIPAGHSLRSSKTVVNPARNQVPQDCSLYSFFFEFQVLFLLSSFLSVLGHVQIKRNKKAGIEQQQNREKRTRHLVIIMNGGKELYPAAATRKERRARTEDQEKKGINKQQHGEE